MTIDQGLAFRLPLPPVVALGDYIR
jgi:hypothetical protein